MIGGHVKTVPLIGSQRHHIVVFYHWQLHEALLFLVEDKQFSSACHNTSVAHLANVLHGTNVGRQKFKIVSGLSVSSHALISAYPQSSARVVV